MSRSPHARTSPSPIRARCATLAVLALALCLGTGCATGEVRGEAPFAQLSNWRIDGDTLRQDLRLRNVNDAAMALRSIRLEVTLDDDILLYRHTQAVDLEIAPGGFETIALAVTPTGDGLAALDGLSSGEVPNLSYRLEGTVLSAESGELPLRREDRIYRVPGRPGEFR